MRICSSASGLSSQPWIRLKGWSAESTSRENRLLVVSLNIANNSLPQGVIGVLPPDSEGHLRGQSGCHGPAWDKLRGSTGVGPSTAPVEHGPYWVLRGSLPFEDVSSVVGNIRDDPRGHTFFHKHTGSRRGRYARALPPS